MIRSEQLLGSGHKAGLPGLSGQVQSTKPHLHTKAQRDMGCPARVPHSSTKWGHTAYIGGQGTQLEQGES